MVLRRPPRPDVTPVLPQGWPKLTEQPPGARPSLTSARIPNIHPTATWTPGDLRHYAIEHRRAQASPPVSHQRCLGVRKTCLPHTGTYTGDPPSGLTIRRAFFGWKSDKEVCGGVVSVFSE